jgi:hypothetical protein
MLDTPYASWYKHEGFRRKAAETCPEALEGDREQEA